MIVSHKHKFIFLKTQKTAGTSLQVALSEHCGEDDLTLGPMYKEETIKILKRTSIPPTVFTSRDTIDERYYKGTKKGVFFNPSAPKSYSDHHEVRHPHCPLSPLKKAVGDKIWNGYFKFAFIRNPFDCIISKYHFDFYKKGNRGVPGGDVEGFRKYVKDKKYHHSQYPILFYPWLCDIEKKFSPSLTTKTPYILRESEINPYDKGIDVDFVGKYENLNEDINHIGKKLGLKITLPKINAHTKPKVTAKINEYYDKETYSIIKEYFKHDINKFYKNENKFNTTK